MKHRHTTGFCIGLLLLLTSCSGKVNTTSQPNPPPDETGKTIGRSANWKVEIVFVKKGPDPSYPPQPNISQLSLKLKIEYLGPAGPVKAPLVNVVHLLTGTLDPNKELKAPLSGIEVEGEPDPETLRFIIWLSQGQPKPGGEAESPAPQETMQLESGKKVEVILNFRYLDFGARDFRLSFADIPRIPFNVQR